MMGGSSLRRQSRGGFK